MEKVYNNAHSDVYTRLCGKIKIFLYMHLVQVLSKVSVLSLFLISTLLVALAAFSANAKYASIVVDAKTGKILHQTNIDTRNYPASLTKMMTLFMVMFILFP